MPTSAQPSKDLSMVGTLWKMIDPILLTSPKSAQESRDTSERKSFCTRMISSSKQSRYQIIFRWTEPRFSNDQSQTGWINLTFWASLTLLLMIRRSKTGGSWTMRLFIRRASQSLLLRADLEWKVSLRSSETGVWQRLSQVLWKMMKTLIRLHINGLAHEWSTDSVFRGTKRTSKLHFQGFVLRRRTIQKQD